MAEDEKNRAEEEQSDPAAKLSPDEERALSMNNIGFVYAGPQQMNDPSMMSAYAGPAAMMMAVYAGPQQMPVTLMAYAGPSNNGIGIGIINQVPEKKESGEDPGPFRFCPECGEMCFGGNFCRECGKPLKDQPWYRKCKSCGTPVLCTQKFCHECGTPTPPEGTVTV